MCGCKTTRHFVVGMSAAAFLDALEAQGLRGFWRGSGRFVIQPPWYLHGVPQMEGFCRESAGGCETRIYVRLMPPLWFMFFFVYAPVILFVAADVSVWLMAAWIGFGNVCIAADLDYACRAFRELDAAMQSLGAVRVEAERRRGWFYAKRAGIYLLIAVIYIALM
ncbi:MAG: hypothetical protein IH624_14400, partial [Phycisphaerae bacterium]|nr:hypothetical protein [Phycisphaerae bacterium]